MAAQREIRYIGSAWQVTALPDGTKELAFNDPDMVTLHVLPLPKGMAEALAAQLRGDADDEGPAPLQVAEAVRRVQGGSQGGSSTSIGPGDPYPPEHRG